jgi:predicted transcriptional regulator
MSSAVSSVTTNVVNHHLAPTGAGTETMEEDVKRSIGGQERALLQYVAEAGGSTVGAAAEGFGVPRGLARSTVLTMMERLRHKGFLRRVRAGGVWRYQSKASPDELLRSAVASFVSRTLAGSLSPFVSYLAEGAEVSDGELAELEQLVARLQSKRDQEGRE